MSASTPRPVTDARENNFNLLRLVAASSVIFSHGPEITRGEHDALGGWIGYTGGWIAVSAFFSISGMLIYRSMTRSGSIRDYLTARFLRIFPGLWVMLLVTAVALGVVFSTAGLADWLLNRDVQKYVGGNAVLYALQYLLPGVFESNPIAGINGSLWTLRFEFTCYLAVLALFLLRAYRSERAFAITCVVYALMYSGFLALEASRGNLHDALLDGNEFAKLHRLSLAFFLGMVVGRYVDRLRPQWWAVCAATVACGLSFGTFLFPTLLTLLTAVMVFWIAFAQQPWLVPFRRMQDYSYGIYIYAFPVQQFVEHAAPTLPSLWNALIGLAITVPLAAMSWHFVERPALNLKSRLSGAR